MATKIIYEGKPGERDFFDLLCFHRTVGEIGGKQQGLPSPSSDGVTTTYKVGDVFIRYQVASADEQSRTPRRVRVTLEGNGNMDDIEVRIKSMREKSNSTQPDLGLVGALAEKH